MIVFIALFMWLLALIPSAFVGYEFAKRMEFSEYAIVSISNRS